MPNCRVLNRAGGISLRGAFLRRGAARQVPGFTGTGSGYFRIRWKTRLQLVGGYQYHAMRRGIEPCRRVVCLMRPFQPATMAEGHDGAIGIQQELFLVIHERELFVGIHLQEHRVDEAAAGLVWIHGRRDEE